MRVFLPVLLLTSLGCGTTETPMPRPTNRLAKEKSPYLLQHAHNPVDWYPWGQEAFDKAKREQKPIFLSIGYSTCHWCHVMERESFESDAIAKILNERFVPIKVDREERPDVDQVYMAAVQGMGQGGGWPLSVWLTPDLKPFFGGTYFPPEDRWGRIGFATLLERLHEAWTTKRDAILRDGANVATALADAHKDEARPGAIDESVIKRAAGQLEAQFDPEWGGFGNAPKFPRSVVLEFLMRRHARGDERAFPMVKRTLEKMAEGGMYDQLGGGFARYSTDREWLVPHFEKMLYDNALLLRSYVQAWRISKDPFFERIARETIEYVFRDMRSPDGAFYSAEDADSEGIEGKFYVWNPPQIAEVLGERDAAVFCAAFDVTAEGNWEPHEPGIPRGNSCLRVVAFDEKRGIPRADWDRVIAEGKKKLTDARSKRVRPLRDDKVLTEWNALMISALSMAGSAFDEPRYVEAAKKAASFVLAKLRRADGRLLRRWRDGEAAGLAVLDDYAFLADALVDLYEATFDVAHVETAVALTTDMIALFGDPDGGFWFTGKDGETLIARMKEIYDGALPSGNAVALHALTRLAALTGRDDFRKTAEATVNTFAGTVARTPFGYPHFLSGFDRLSRPSREIVIAGDSPELLREVRRSYLPDAVVAWAPAGGPDARSVKALPILESRTAVDGRPAVYVCENASCKLPVTTVEELRPLLGTR